MSKQPPSPDNDASSDVSADERAGPRPLAFHLASALSALGGSMVALPSSLAGKIPTDTGWGAEANEFATALADLAAEDMLPAAGQEAVRRLQVMLQGIEAYRRHPYKRNVEDPPAVWQDGSTRLLDYGEVDGASADGRPVLFVPSLVNRGYVLDISARRSMLRWLATRGLRPLLVDWGTPGEAEKDFSLDDYIAGIFIDIGNSNLAPFLRKGNRTGFTYSFGPTGNHNDFIHKTFLHKSVLLSL